MKIEVRLRDFCRIFLRVRSGGFDKHAFLPMGTELKKFTVEILRHELAWLIELVVGMEVKNDAVADIIHKWNETVFSRNCRTDVVGSGRFDQN